MVGVIGLVRPIMADGLTEKGEGIAFSLCGDQSSPISFGILVLSKSFWETVFLAEVFFFLSSLFDFILVDCCLEHCSPFASFI